MAGCENNTGTHGHSHDVAGGHDQSHDHATDEITESYTLYTDKYELFVEFPFLIAGQTSSFAAHLTLLETHKPLTKGKLTVSMTRDGKGIRHKVEGTTSPGIFRPALQPKEAGIYNLFFSFESKHGNARFQVGKVRVFSDPESIPDTHDKPPALDEVVYLKEQAWNTGFKTDVVALQPFHQVIHTTGKVISETKSELTLNAYASGVVILEVLPGKSVRKGDLIALITGSGIENNLQVKLNESRIAFEKSKADYVRSKPLVKKRILSEKAFLEVETNYRQDSIRYYQIAEMVSEDGLEITAPFSGLITSIEAKNGTFLESGTPIATLTGSNRFLIVAHVNQSDHNLVGSIFSSHFSIAGADKTISLEELEGQIITRNPFIPDGSTRIPVTFSVSGNDILIPGMFIEAFLLADRKDNAVVVPLSALVEEQGQYFVFVQLGGETFLKKQVSIGGNDGKNAEVISGLVPGDRIVTRGAQQIRLADLSGDLPLHGHTH